MRKYFLVSLFVILAGCGGNALAQNKPPHDRRPKPTTTTIKPVTTTTKPTTTTVTIPNSTTTTTVPSSSCSGVNLSPGANLTTAVNNAASGTTFCLAAGNYPQSASVLMKSNDTIIGPGAILDFTGASLTSLYCVFGYHGTGGQFNVTLDGLEVKNCAGIAVKDGDNWTNRNLYLHDSLIGLDGGCDTCRILHNPEYGVTGAETISNTELGWNGGTPDSGGSTGGSKAVQLANSHWLNDYVHDNLGQAGVWCDGCYQGSTFVVDGGTYTHNQGSGVDIEISYGATIKNVTFTDNAYDTIGQSCWYGADVRVADSPGATVSNNRIDASAGENAICTVDSTRTDGPALTTPFAATNNNITVGASTLIGDAGNGNGDTFSPSNYLFSGTVYSSTSGNHWTLNSNNPLTFPQWQALGQQ